MNRNLKFRAWDKRTNVMFYSDENQTVWAGGLEISVNSNKGKILGDFVGMQFINVTDINNIEVYEGDKVKGRYMVQRSLDPNAEPEIIHFEGVIKYAEGCFYVKADNGKCVFSFTYPDYELEVVGNEFDGVA